MSKIKLNISGNFVTIIIPAAQSFFKTREQVKKVIIKNYKLLRTVKFYKLDGANLRDEQLLVLEKDIETLINLSAINSVESDKKIIEEKDDFKLHYGNLRSGEKIISETNLIILGNLNPGSYVKSKKNIFIYGKARGTICVGSNLDEYETSFIYIEEADLPKIRIGNKQILYEEKIEVNNLIFKKKDSKIYSEKIEKPEIQKLLKKIGFKLI
jgi:septum formation inhibitor MinC